MSIEHSLAQALPKPQALLVARAFRGIPDDALSVDIDALGARYDELMPSADEFRSFCNDPGRRGEFRMGLYACGLGLAADIAGLVMRSDVPRYVGGGLSALGLYLVLGSSRMGRELQFRKNVEREELSFLLFEAPAFITDQRLVDGAQAIPEGFAINSHGGWRVTSPPLANWALIHGPPDRYGGAPTARITKVDEHERDAFSAAPTHLAGALYTLAERLTRPSARG